MGSKKQSLDYKELQSIVKGYHSLTKEDLARALVITMNELESLKQERSLCPKCEYTFDD